MLNREDYYQILGINPDASQEEIKKAYRYKVFILHPDRLKGFPESTQRQAEKDFKKVNQAHQVLKDPQQRQQYHSEWLRQGGKSKKASLSKPKPAKEKARVSTKPTPLSSPSSPPSFREGILGVAIGVGIAMIALAIGKIMHQRVCQLGYSDTWILIAPLAVIIAVIIIGMSAAFLLCTSD